ncbi:MAG TPA: LPS export ABC transporter periplasmic protein LptC [Balneola sp.]|nr:LPS export ABC transporter periplasmic protein LptC [Balneola sp.]
MGPLNYIIALAFIFLMIAQCTQLSEYDNERIQEALGDSLITSSTTRNLNMDVIENGALKLNLKSSRALSITKDRTKTTYLSGPVSIDIFKSDSLDTEVSADSAIYLPKDAQFELFGNVIVHSQNGRFLYSDYLKWLREDDEVTTPGRVLIITKTDSIAATGFVGNTDLTNYTLTEVTGKTQFN